MLSAYHTPPVKGEGLVPVEETEQHPQDVVFFHLTPQDEGGHPQGEEIRDGETDQVGDL